jgi:large-conductance mechanosensitive channel
MFGRILEDIKSFISGRDLVVFAITLALANQLQITLNKFIETMIMPFIARLLGGTTPSSTPATATPGTGVAPQLQTSLANRAIDLETASGKDLGIRLGWGAAVQSILVFFISLVIMVELARYITVHFVTSSSVKFT